MCLPLNTTHAAQPLNISFFGPLKKHWSSVYHSYVSENSGKVVTKHFLWTLAKHGTKQSAKNRSWISQGWNLFDHTAIQAVSLDECRAGVDPVNDVDEHQFPEENLMSRG